MFDDINLKIILTSFIWLVCAICLFFIVAVARVDASTNALVTTDDLINPLKQTNLNILEYRVINRHWNDLGYMSIYSYNFKSGSTYDFFESLVYVVEPVYAGVSTGLTCDNIAIGAQMLKGNRVGTQISISNRSWQQVGCEMDGQTLRATYSFRGTFTGVSDTRITSRHFFSTTNLVAAANIKIMNQGIEITPHDATNSDVIENNNYNTQNIINNSTQNTENITNSINDLNSSLTDTTPPELDSLISGIVGTDDKPISQLLLMPLTFINFYVNSMSSTCTDYSFGTLLGTELKLTCIDFDDLLSSNLYHNIDLMMCMYVIYNLALLVVSAFNDITSLEDTFDSLYRPRHAYFPKHAKEYK